MPPRSSVTLAEVPAAMPPDMAEAQKARADFVKRKSSSFIANAKRPEEEKQKAMAAFKSDKFSKSLSAQEVKAVCPMTGEEDTWIRPTIHFDESPDHVPPPPPLPN